MDVSQECQWGLAGNDASQFAVSLWKGTRLKWALALCPLKLCLTHLLRSTQMIQIEH